MSYNQQRQPFRAHPQQGYPYGYGNELDAYPAQGYPAGGYPPRGGYPVPQYVPKWSYEALLRSPLLLRLAPAVGIIVFVVWGLGPVMRYGMNLFRNDNNWKKCRTRFILISYLQPILLCTGATLICSFFQQTQKRFMEKSRPDDIRNMGFQFARRAICSALWIVFVSSFMGFSTQKWLTAGGLGTMLLIIAGLEIFTNFMSSIMIHATHLFIVNERIQTVIEGYEVSGTVKHVGWWSTTVIRGKDGEAVHIPNHKFTNSVVRNLSRKTHWLIKNHLTISHLDVDKIDNLIADMRNVLETNPEIEQQGLHRRVFLDDINSKNQTLLILVSCYVKTSHVEEYLRVKGAILKEFVGLISHHGGRLVTQLDIDQNIC